MNPLVLSIAWMYSAPNGLSGSVTSKLPGVSTLIGVPPAIALADPDEVLAAVQPVHFIIDIDPGAVTLTEDRVHGARVDIPEHHIERVLEAVQVLENQLAGVGGPVHPGDVVIARVTRDREPLRGAAAGADDADAS